MINNVTFSYNIVICSIVRNCAKQLKKNIVFVDELRKYFKSSHVIIYENDSTDNTKSILEFWQKKSNNIILKFETLKEETIPKESSNGFNKYFSKQRISKMAYFRNRYMAELESLNLLIDFVIILDLDVIKIDINGVLNSFELSNQWDIVTSNGYSRSPSLKKRYHDSFALVEIGKENYCQTEDSILKNQSKWSFLKKGLPLIPVYSAYGGLAIYKYEFIKGLKYGVVLNDDSRVQVRCEHYFLHDEITKKYGAKIFINPSMIIQYQKIDIELIIKTIKEKFRLFFK